MFAGLYRWTQDLAGHRHARWGLALLACIESAFFPVPVDVALIPMVLARRERAFEYALICTIASVIGGGMGYAIGYFLFETVGMWLLNLYGYNQAFEDFAASYNEYGAWIVFVGGVTPIPYKVVTIASGVTQLNLGIFLLASVASRAIRFYAVCGLFWWFGPVMSRFMDRYSGLATTLFVIIVIGGFVALPLIF